MRDKIFVKMLLVSLVISFVLPGHLLASSPKVIVDPTIVSKWNRMRKNWLTIKTPSQLEKEVARMNFQYNSRFEKQDKKFMELLAAQETELPEIKINNDKLEISDKKSSSSKVTIQTLGENKYLINGKSFEYDMYSSLETNLDSIKSIFEKKEVSFLDQLLLPSAYASKLGNGILIATAVCILGAIGYSLYEKKSGGRNHTPAHSNSSSGMDIGFDAQF